MNLVTVYRVSNKDRRLKGPFTSDQHTATPMLVARCNTDNFPSAYLDVTRFNSTMILGVTSKKMLRYWFPLTLLRAMYRDGFTVWRLKVPAGQLRRGRSKTQVAFHLDDASNWEALTLEQLFPTKQGQDNDSPILSQVRARPASVGRAPAIRVRDTRGSRRGNLGTREQRLGAGR